MSRLDELPPDQRAALSLLLGQRKSYAEVAAMLAISEGAVHDRAHAALAVLAPRLARELAPERREEIADYLLAQQPGVADRLRTRTFLSASEPARAWAQALAGELAPLASGPLPEIPVAAAVAGAGAASPAVGLLAAAERAPGGASPSPSAPSGFAGAGSPASSRLGGALVLGAIVAAVVVAILLLTNGGSKAHSPAASAGKAAATAAAPTVNARIPMSSPSRAGHGLGLLEVASQGSKRAFLLIAEKLTPTHGFFYALWLYNGPGSHEPLGRAPAVASNGILQGGGALPADAGQFSEVLLTRETSIHATHPGRVILRGRFTLGG
jgi:hypothetical protein